MKQTAFPISEILKEVLKELKKKQEILPKEINWEKIAGKELALHTRPVGIRRKILYIEVDSSVLLSELSHFKKQELLQRIHTLYPATCRDIKFILRR